MKLFELFIKIMSFWAVVLSLVVLIRASTPGTGLYVLFRGGSVNDPYLTTVAILLLSLFGIFKKF